MKGWANLARALVALYAYLCGGRGGAGGMGGGGAGGPVKRDMVVKEDRGWWSRGYGNPSDAQCSRIPRVTIYTRAI